MENSTSSTLSYFILGAYLNVGILRYLYFMITALLYIVIVIANSSLIVVICMNRSLHEPMYLFLCSLFVNELYVSTGFFPFLLIQILSDIHTVSTSFCYLQMFSLYTFVNIEFCNLAVLSYDRYLAICCPLQYNTRMTSRKVFILIFLIWLSCVVKVVITLLLNIRLTLCGNAINSLYCRNYLVVKLACSDTTVNNIYGLFATVLSVGVLLPIIFSYTRILKVCFSGSKQTRQKAVSTCTPQLVSLINFSFGCCLEIIQSRIDVSILPSVLSIILSVYFLILQPLLNPIMFGLQMSKIRKTYIHMCCHKNRDTVRGNYNNFLQIFFANSQQGRKKHIEKKRCKLTAKDLRRIKREATRNPICSSSAIFQNCNLPGVLRSTFIGRAKVHC